MIKAYWNDALLIAAAVLPLIFPIHPHIQDIQAAVIIALAAYGIYVKYKASKYS